MALALAEGLAGKFETLFDRTEELAGNIVDVLQGGDDVGRRGDGFEKLNSFQRIRHFLHPFETISVPVTKG